MDFKARTLLVVSLFLYATFCTNGVYGGKGGKGKGGKGKGAPVVHYAPRPAVLPTVALWRSYDAARILGGQAYDPLVAAATARYAGGVMRDIAAGKGKGKGKGKNGGEIGLDRIEDRGRKQAHEFMEGGRADHSYYSFYYGATTDAEAARGSLTGVRVVIEVDPSGAPTGRYWVTEHPAGEIERGERNQYQNWSQAETL